MDYENQKMLEHLFDKNQVAPLLRRELLDTPALVAHVNLVCEFTHLNDEFIYDLLAHLILAKRSTPAAAIGVLSHHFKDKSNPAQACADALTLLTEAELFGFDEVRYQLVVRYDIDQKTADLIQQYQYLPPMIVPPLLIKDNDNNKGSGYITVTNDSLILQDNHHLGDICVDSLNRFNAVALSVNVGIVKSIRNHWKGIDRQKEDETFQEYQERLKAFTKYEKDSFNTIALMVEMGNKFYLTHKIDKRGRTYSQGYHINPQGNCWNKAVVELANKEMIE